MSVICFLRHLIREQNYILKTKDCELGTDPGQVLWKSLFRWCLGILSSGEKTELKLIIMSLVYILWKIISYM